MKAKEISLPALEFRNSAIQGRGAFAKDFIPAEAQIIQYVGEKITKAEAKRRCDLENPYIFTLDDEFDLDGDVDWNPARFINHSCEPNCNAEMWGTEIWIIARRDIQPGEELTFNYSYGLEDYLEHPCKCGARKCVGFIVAEEFFAKVRKKQKKLA